MRSVRSVCNKDIENREISGLLEELKHTDLTDHTDFLACGLLLLWDSWICNVAQKMTSVSHAKHRQIREICEIRVL